MAEATRIADGTSIKYTPSADVAAGEVLILGTMVGVAPVPIANGEPGTVEIDGEFLVAKVSTDEFAVGAVVYFNGTSNLATSTASGATLMGKAVAAAANPSTHVRVVLNRAS